MPQSHAQIKKEILEPRYIELHGGNVQYFLKDIHGQVGEIFLKDMHGQVGEIHSDKYTFPKSELDELISKAISKRPKYASATVEGEHIQYDAVTGDPYSPQRNPRYTPVDLELTLKMVGGEPVFTVEEKKDWCSGLRDSLWERR